MRTGVIGGSGLDDPGILKNPSTETVHTDYGPAVLNRGMMGDKEIFLIARHGKNHELAPGGVNYRANIAALKLKNVDGILATTACGSLKEEVEPGDFVIPDQFIDFTKNRKSTFFTSFENGITHTPMADPFDPKLRKILLKTAGELNFKTHEKGTVITIEGPRFSTRAESIMFQSWGADIINMSTATEAALANEAEIPYGVVAMSTDYDCWKQDEEPVSWERIMEIFQTNAQRVKELLIQTIKTI